LSVDLPPCMAGITSMVDNQIAELKALKPRCRDKFPVEDRHGDNNKDNKDGEVNENDNDEEDWEEDDYTEEDVAKIIAGVNKKCRAYETDEDDEDAS
jgi:hypothetical protein